MIQVEMYSKDNCHLCDGAYDVLFKVQKKIPFDLKVIKIREGDKLYERYAARVPVVLINGQEAFQYNVPEEDFIQQLKDVQAQMGE
jgi:glutaredoxin